MVTAGYQLRFEPNDRAQGACGGTRDSRRAAGENFERQPDAASVAPVLKTAANHLLC
jgi:hypothetical protein